MKKNIRTAALITAAVLGVSGAAAQNRQAGSANRINTAPPSVSVRPPDSHRTRTALTAPLGWRAGIASNAFPGLTFSEAAAKADALGLASIEGYSTQKVSPQIQKNLDYNLSSSDIDAVKHRLGELRMHMAVYHVAGLGPDETARKVFGLAKALRVETIVAAPEPASLSALDKLANEFGINVAVEGNDPKSLRAVVKDQSKRIGVAGDLAAWTKAGVKPADAAGILKDRIMVVGLRNVGAGGAGLNQFLVQLSRVTEPESLVSPDKCTNCGRPLVGLKPVFLRLEPSGGGDPLADLQRSSDAFEKVIRVPMGDRVDRISRATPITASSEVPAAERAAIEAALPHQPVVKPKKARKLLVLDLCPAGGYYHATIAHANLALELLARYTGAYEPTFSNDLDNLKYPKIKQWDAVFLNSVVGELFPDPDVMNGLARFVREGGGLAGVHGSTYASMDLPEYGDLIGAQDGPHRVEKATLKIDDPNSPLTKHFAHSSLTKALGGNEFVYTDEFYHFLPTGPYSRGKLHVLISIDNAKSDMTQWKDIRPDGDYGLSWIRSYGNGRVFNNAMGHTPTLFSTPELAEYMLAAIQYVLGDLDADATPTTKLPASK